MTERTLRERIDGVLDRVDIVDVVGRVVPLRGGRATRGKCPFHGSTSESLSIVAAPQGGGKPFAHCFGCGWHGDAVKFVADFHGLEFMDALVRLEQDHGLEGLTAAPVHREKAPQSRREGARQLVDSAALGRFVWETGVADFDAIRTYFRARAVPDAMLTPERLRDFRFVRVAPIVPWEIGRKPTSVPTAPAIAALIRRPIPPAGVEGGKAWQAIGAHITFLAPDLADKMTRQRGDGSLYPARKMCGDAKGGCVVLGAYHTHVPIYVGEGNETVFSGMDLAKAGDDACGLAALSLDNLQGFPLTARKGALPLYDIQPDPARPGLAFQHDGKVIGLIDADMKPLRGVKDQATGRWRGLPIISARGDPITWRAIGTAERATICAELFVKSWRAAGSRRVEAFRAPMGMDFNDVGRAAA
jgi:DNA primase